ncbi:MAG: hypothetical protein ACK5P7_02295 [Bdellovibrio sp.]
MQKILVSLMTTNLMFSSFVEAKPVVVPKQETVVEDSSAHHRVDKRYSADAILTGIGPSITGTAGVQLGYYLDHDSLVILELTRGNLRSDSQLTSSTVGSKYEITSGSIGGHYKNFVGNSFYYRAGGDFRTLDYKYTFTSGVVDTATFKGTSLVANIQIGNQWQWENFTLGCDWVGFVLPIYSQIKDDVVNSSTPSLERKRLDDDAQTLVKSNHITLLRFYLGASF